MSTKSVLRLALLSLFATPLLFSASASAITVGNDVELEFTLESSISITTSGSLSIEGLISGGEAATSTSSLVVTVDSNSAGGYTLGATVGSSANASTNLTSSTVGYGSFSMLSSSDDAISLSSFTGNSWGISIDGGSTFIGLPLYTDAAKTIKTTTTTASSDTLSIKLGARAASGVESGTYTNVINFIAVTQLPPFDGITTMQAMTPTICQSTAVGASRQLIDTRDNKLYWVTKLADGNCWMTQNLDFVISTSGTTLTTSDSDVSSSKTLTATNGWTATDISFYEGGDNYIPNGTGSATSASDLATNSSDLHYHQGNYYNWPAATAGSGDSSIASANASESICPKGWRLPTSNSTTVNYSFGKLLAAYNYSSDSDSSLLTAPLFFVRGGRIYSGSLGASVGNYGYYWSSMADSSVGGVYHLSFASSGVFPTDYSDDSRGFSVRCVARSTEISQITTMQQFGSLSNSGKNAVLDSMSVGTQYTLKDTRDNKYYYISKLADGNVWMTQNLDLDITTAGLTNADTDLNSVTAWNSSSTYAPQATLTATSSSSADTDTYSWDLGDYAYDGTTNSSCGASATSYADCTSYGFSATSSPTVSANHYHVGNLYQWNAATAGSGGTITSTEASDSICPKGWRLPTSTSSGEFQTLVTAYSAGSTVQTLIDSPLYFVRGGYVSYRGTLSNAGDDGNYWPSTAYPYDNMAYQLRFFYTNIVQPSSYYDRRYGFSVRCVLR